MVGHVACKSDRASNSEFFGHPLETGLLGASADDKVLQVGHLLEQFWEPAKNRSVTFLLYQPSHRHDYRGISEIVFADNPLRTFAGPKGLDIHSWSNHCEAARG